MTDDQRRRLVDSMNELAGKIQREPDFMGDDEMKALYVVIHSATAALMFRSLHGLADVCADWCGDEAQRTVEGN